MSPESVIMVGVSAVVLGRDIYVVCSWLRHAPIACSKRLLYTPCQVLTVKQHSAQGGLTDTID